MPEENSAPASATQHSFDDGRCDVCNADESYREHACPGPIEDRPRRCCVHRCCNEVACFGSYEGSPEAYACDEHCGHGCEDGECWPVPNPGASAERANTLEWWTP